MTTNHDAKLSSISPIRSFILIEGDEVDSSDLLKAIVVALSGDIIASKCSARIRL